MAQTAMTSLQDQIEAVRREAFAAGYAAAMKEVRELAGKAAPSAGSAAASRGGATRARRGRPARTARATRATRTTRAVRTTRRGRPAAATAAARPAAATPRAARTTRRARTAAATPRAARRTARSRSARPQRGTNARYVEEVLQAAAPRALRPAEIRSAVQKGKGVSMAFTSIRHALGQLEQRRAIEQVGDSKTWRSREGGSAD